MEGEGRQRLPLGEKPQSQLGGERQRARARGSQLLQGARQGEEGASTCDCTKREKRSTNRKYCFDRAI